MFNDKVLTPKELEQLAANLSNYGGPSTSGMMMYTGENDDMLDFEDQELGNFAGESSVARQFTFTIENKNSASVLRAKIFSGYNIHNPTLSVGQMKDGFFKDVAEKGTGTLDGLIGSAAGEKEIVELLQFLLQNPSRVVGMKIQSDTALQLENDFVIKDLNPFKQTESRYIRPKNFQNQATFQDKTVVFPCELHLDNQTEVTYSFLPLSRTSITLYFGASLNTAKALKKRAQKAKANINYVGPDRVVAQSRASMAGFGGTRLLG
jgi:hypothetical protein